jgi:hypothetical protein
MTKLTWGRVAAAGVLTLGLSTFLPSQGAIAASAQATPAAADPWRLVPALVTSCFAEDDFNDRLRAASEAIGVEMENQKKINEVAKERFDKMDMMEKAQRMQAFMMKNPQEAMKMMQAEQAAGTAAQTAIAGANESAARLEAEYERLQGAFRAAAEQAVTPVRARQQALIKAKTILLGEAAIPAFTTAADHAQYVQLIAEENAAYERACAPYFGPNGSFHKWASSYRTEVVEKLVGDGSGDAVMIMQMKAMDLPGGNYRSTNPLQQANNFITRVGRIWGIRQNKTKPTVELVKK